MRNGFSSGSIYRTSSTCCYRHHGTKHFDLNAIGNMSDADLLLTALRRPSFSMPS